MLDLCGDSLPGLSSRERLARRAQATCERMRGILESDQGTRPSASNPPREHGSILTWARQPESRQEAPSSDRAAFPRQRLESGHPYRGVRVWVARQNGYAPFRCSGCLFRFNQNYRLGMERFPSARVHAHRSRGFCSQQVTHPAGSAPRSPASPLHACKSASSPRWNGRVTPAPSECPFPFPASAWQNSDVECAG